MLFNCEFLTAGLNLLEFLENVWQTMDATNSDKPRLGETAPLSVLAAQDGNQNRAT